MSFVGECISSRDRRWIIADPRHDENLMISGLQVAFPLFHNRVVDKLRDDGEDLNEFLPQIIDGAILNDILSRGPRFYTPRPGEQSIPVEFQAAAYRFGHSLVRPSYRANLAGVDGGLCR